MKTISRIAYSNDKKNKTRSILIMMSICLTTMLLMIISTVGNGMIRLQKSQAASSYGSNYGLFVAADASQLKGREPCSEPPAGSTPTKAVSSLWAFSVLLWGKSPKVNGPFPY